MNKVYSSLQFVTFISIFTFCLISCSKNQQVVVKKPSKPKNVEALISLLQKNELKFDWLSLKANAEAAVDSKKNSFKANIRIKKDSAIWISISPLVGIEIVRLLATKDSVKMLNRLQSNYFIGGYEYLGEKMNADINFYMLQAILVGNSMVEEIEVDEAKVSNKKDHYLLSSLKKGKLKKAIEKHDKIDKTIEKVGNIVSTLWINNTTFKVDRQGIYDLKEDLSLAIDYTKFEVINDINLPQEKQLLPHNLALNFSGRSEGELKISYTKATLNKAKKLSFAIPEKYEQVYY